MSRYAAEGLRPVLEIAGDGRLEAALGQIMVGWSLRPAGAAAAGLRVVQGPGGWTCSGAGLEAPETYPDPVAAGCGVLANLFHAQTLEDAGTLCLHAAGIRIGDGVVLLTGDYRAGKSLLAAACCAAGQQVFSDDIVPLTPEAGVARAPGLALRLRLPLPGTLAPATRAFLDAHRVLAGRRYAYVRPPRHLLAPHGTEAPVRGLVSLDRRAGGTARLLALSPGAALAELVRRNFAREMPAGRILAALDALVVSMPCLRLGYADAGEAAELLRRAFASGDVSEFVSGDAAGFESEAPEAPEAPRPGSRTAPALSGEAVIGRAAGVSLRQRGDHAFLTDAAEQVIHHLNPTGAAVWRVLEEPVRLIDLVDLFAAAFPDRPVEALRADLARLIGDLAASGLVEIVAVPEV